MPIADLLRALVVRGIGLTLIGGDIGVFPSRYPSPGPTLTSELRSAIRSHKPAFVRLVDERVIRRAWRITDETPPLRPQVVLILAWLLIERMRFTRHQYRLWLEHKSRHVDEGAPSFVADILATETVACEQLFDARGLEAVA